MTSFSDEIDKNSRSMCSFLGVSTTERCVLVRILLVEFKQYCSFFSPCARAKAFLTHDSALRKYYCGGKPRANQNQRVKKYRATTIQLLQYARPWASEAVRIIYDSSLAIGHPHDNQLNDSYIL